MKTILSLQNDTIKQVKSLHTTKGRNEHQLFIAEGLRAIEALLTGKTALKYLFYTAETLELGEELYPKIMQFWPEAALILISETVMAKISTLDTPVGILAVFAIPQLDPSATPLTSGVVLAQIADPGNMGTLIRTAAAMDYQTVVIVDGTDAWSPKVVQASAGTICQVNIFKLSWQELLTHKAQLKLCALVVKDGTKPQSLDLKNSLMVVGSEAHGLPQEWAANCDQHLTLPMPGNAESLNAAVAGSIALYLSKFN